MPARKGHLRFPNFVRVAPADLASRVEVQVAVAQCRYTRQRRRNARVADGEEVRA